MKWILVVFVILAVVVTAAFLHFRASDIEMAQARRAFDVGRFDVAEAAFERATRYAPADAEAWYWLGITRKCEGKIPGAADALVKATELKPDNVLWWFECARLLQWAKRYPEAEHAWKQTLELLPPDDDYRRNEARISLARTIAAQGQIDRSAAILEKMLGEKEDPQIRFVLAELLAWAGRFEESAKQYRIALQQQSETQP